MERFFRYALAILISIVALMEFYQVLMRYVFKIPVMGLEEVLVYPTLWLYFMGSVNASFEDTQIKANVLDVFLKSERARLVVRLAADAMSLVVACWLTYWAWDYFRYALRVHKESPTLYIPTIYAECAFFIGLLLMTAFAAWHLSRNVMRLVSLPKAVTATEGV